MFREIDAKCYIMIDGDDTYPLEYAREMVDAVLLHGRDMIIGDRLSSTYYQENKRLFRNFGIAFMIMSDMALKNRRDFEFRRNLIHKLPQNQSTLINKKA